MEQSRWKSWAYWTTLIVGFVAFLTTIGVWDWIGVSVDCVDNIVGGFISFGTLIFGNFNNPTNPNGWGANKITKE